MPSDTFLLASLVVPPVCLVLALLALWWWWRRIRRQLALHASLHPPEPLRAIPVALNPLPASSQASKLDFPRRTGRDEEEALGERGPSRQRLHRGSTLTISTRVTDAGVRVFARRSTTEFASREERRSRTSSRPLSGFADSGSTASRASASVGEEGRAGCGRQRRSRGGLGEKEGRSFEAEGARDVDGEATEELVEGDPPSSSEWMKRSFPRGRKCGDGNEARAAFSTPQPVEPRPVSSFARSAGDPQFLPRQQRSSFFLHQAYLNASSAPPVARPNPTSKALIAARRSTSYRFSASPEPTPPSSPAPVTQTERSPLRHHRSQVTSAPTLLESALLRSTSSPELRPPIRPMPPLHSSTTLSAPACTDTADTDVKQAESRSSSAKILSTQVMRPSSTDLAGKGGTSSVPPPSPLSRRDSTPPLTDFPVPTFPRPTRFRPPISYRTTGTSLSNRSLPSSSFHSSTHAVVSPLTTTPSSRWSFRRQRTSSSNPTSSTGLRWSGSWGKLRMSGGAGAEEGGGKRVSTELLAPLSASVRQAKPEEGVEERVLEPEELDGIDEAAQKAHRRDNSVGTLASHLVRGEGIAKVGGGTGPLVLTNPDPASTRQSSDHSPCLSVRTSLRFSFETAPQSAPAVV